MKLAIGSLAFVLAGFVLITWWALESSGVAVLETRAPDGALRSTHVWFAEPEPVPDGELWIEAGTAQNSWYLDIQGDPVVSFSSAQGSGQYIAERVEEPGAHDRIRSLLREKYGVRDWWVGVLFDTSGSIAVQLVPRRGGPGGAGRPS